MKKILTILIIFILCTGCQKEVINEIPKQKNGMKEIYINYNKIVALTDNNEIYVIGDASYGLGVSKDVKNVVEPTKVAENVKQLKIDASTCYIDTKNDLYYTGISLQGGLDEEFVKIKSDVNKVEVCDWSIVITLDNNNTSHAITSAFSGDWASGLIPGKYKEFSELQTDVKQAYATLFLNSYLNLNGELFMIESATVDKTNPVYTKVADNVKKISGEWLLTNDNILYSYVKGLTKIADNVVDIDNYIFKSSDGYFYFESNKNELLIASDIDNYYRLKFDNVKQILYNRSGKYVYLNNENKIEMYTEYDHYIADNDISSMKKILEFVSG